MDQTLVENAEHRSSSKDEQLESIKEHRRSPQQLDALKIQIGAIHGPSQEAKMQGNILANNKRNSNFQQNGHPSEKTNNVGQSKKMMKKLRIKGQRRMSLFDENRKDEKTEVSEVPKDIALSILAIMTLMLVFWVTWPSIKEPCSIRSS